MVLSGNPTLIHLCWEGMIVQVQLRAQLLRAEMWKTLGSRGHPRTCSPLTGASWGKGSTQRRVCSGQLVRGPGSWAGWPDRQRRSDASGWAWVQWCYCGLDTAGRCTPDQSGSQSWWPGGKAHWPAGGPGVWSPSSYSLEPMQLGPLYSYIRGGQDQR